MADDDVPDAAVDRSAVLDAVADDADGAAGAAVADDDYDDDEYHCYWHHRNHCHH